jgi:uncharacterized protein
MPGVRKFPRFVAPRLRESLADTPVVLIHGPRQSGKTTLARSVGEPRGYRYYSFDEDVARAAAEMDPTGFVAELPRRTILDEVQHVPALFSALKTAVDRERVPGRFLLTGSANVLFVPRLADSLAGRMAILRLHPLGQCEVAGKVPRFLDTLFGARFSTATSERLGPALVDRIVAGGYPAALVRRTARRRTAWYLDYVETQVQRDVRDLAQIRALEALPRLLALVAGYTARLINITDIAGAFQLTRQTVHDYVVLLERIFLIDHLPPWHSNRLSRLVKTPKVHIGDTGIACALLSLDAAQLRRDRAMLGPMLETFVYQELKRQASWSDLPVSFHHFRDRDGAEVDLVLDRGGQVAGVEVKAAATVLPADFRGLRKLRETVGDRFVAGVVLYDGETTASFGNGLFAVPVRALWETR